MKQLIKKTIGAKNYNKIKFYFISRKNQKNEKKARKARASFYQNFVSSGDLSFDVGANVGNRIDPLLDLGVKVVAVEPQESCYLHLQSKYGDRIILVTEGLGAEEGEQDFYIANTSTISSFSTEWIDSVKEDRFKEYHWSKVVKTKITTLDKLIEKYGLPKFIKIDVEGYELEVLKGLSSKVNYISIEYTVPELTDKLIECLKQMASINDGVEFNYSVGEGMTFASPNWLSCTEMSEFVKTEEFIKTGFGDVYARNL